MSEVDLRRGMVWPCLIDAHTHLDKAHTWERAPNPDGTFEGAITTVMADRSANWSADDVRQRMEFGLRCSFAHGTKAVEDFLDQPRHHHVFLHRTPTHASWLNQVELFFSILQRRLIRYGEFDSIDDLATKVIAFINDYNKRAKPFRWTYDGRPLQAA